MPVFDKLTMLNFYICVCAGGQEGGGGGRGFHNTLLMIVAKVQSF